MTGHPNTAGQRAWQRWIEAYTGRFAVPGIKVSQMVKLWALSFCIVMIACAVFFLPLMWLFS